jgi:hypothetical protein
MIAYYAEIPNQPRFEVDLPSDTEIQNDHFGRCFHVWYAHLGRLRKSTLAAVGSPYVRDAGPASVPAGFETSLDRLG